MVVEDKKDKTKQKRQDSLSYWLKWIKAAKKAAKRHVDDARAAWREYENQSDISSETKRENTDAALCYPAYWSASKVIEPAYYSMTPNPTTSVEFDWEDSVAELSAIMAERVGKYMLEHSNFDGVMSGAVQDFIHADKATTQITCEIEQEGERVPLMKQEDGSYTTQDGQVHDGEVMEDESGCFCHSPACDEINLAPACYDEIIHTPNAKIWSEVKTIGFHFNMDEDEARERFPDIPDMCFKQGSSDGDKDGDSAQSGAADPVGKYIEGWEIWDEETESVYWVSEDCPLQFLDKKPDPYGLRGFFPCPPFIIGSKPSKSLYPTPAYIQVSPTLRQLHTCYAKVFNLVTGIRRRAIVDGASPELLSALQDVSDNEFVAAQNLNDIVAKGGVQNMIYYIPVQELVAAIAELQNLEDKFKANFYEWFGVPDIIRGVSDPIETLGTQEMKRDAAHDRFRYAKKQVAQLARDSLVMLVDMALKLFSDEKIARIVGLRFMTQEEQQLFPQALAVLRDNEEQAIRIDIETDSIAFIDQRMRAQQRQVVSQTITQGLQQVSSMVQIDPGFAVVALQILLATLDGMEGGKYFIEEVKSAGQKLIDATENPPEAPPPPPDYEMMKINNESRRIDLEAQKLQMDAQNKAQELQLKDAMAQADNNIQMQKVEIEGLKVQNQAQIDATKQALDQSKEEFRQVSDSLLLELEKVKTTANLQDQALQEARLQRQERLDAINTVLNHHAEMLRQAQSAHETAVGHAHEKISLITDHVKALSDRVKSTEEAGGNSPTKNMESRSLVPAVHVHLGGNKKIVRDADGRIESIREDKTDTSEA